MDHEDDLDDPNYDADRYDTAEAWQPTDPYKKQREKVREQMHRNFNYESMLRTLPANEWRFRRQEKAAPPQPLYHDLWFEGELAVLIGARSSAKSVLAVQLGQQIAGGRRFDPGTAGHRDAETSVASSLIPHPSPLIPQSVLYIDCQRSRAQWEERYSSPIFPGDTRRMHHRFPRNFQRAALDWDGTVPDEFHGDLGKFLQYSIMEEIDRSG
ncbi:MAG TPA: AAA family ATPase, partial [Pyrinomonadaceae bacterium]|nr:AAA family ATPase [Pyrinomonadaceae bacterium]